MYCYNCGTKLAEDSRFCPECGTKLNYGTAPAEPTSEAAPAYAQPSVEPSAEAVTPIYVEPIPVPQVKEVQPAAQPQVQPAPQPQAPVSGVSVVRRTVRPLGGIILMFFAIANAILLPIVRLAFRVTNVRILMFEGIMLLAAILILLGMFLHHKKGNILTGIGTILLLVEPVYYVILNGKTVRFLFYGLGVSSSELIYRSARAMMFFSYAIIIPSLIFIALYYLICGKTFGNPLKLFCGLAIMIFGSLYAICLIVIMVSTNAALSGRYVIFTCLTAMTTWFFWLFVGISLIIYTPFKKVRN